MGAKERKHLESEPSLSSGIIMYIADVAQLVEHFVANEKVVGSSPIIRSMSKYNIGDRMVAIWGMKDGNNRMAGWGEYLGDLPCPALDLFSEEEVTLIIKNADASFSIEKFVKQWERILDWSPEYVEERKNAVLKEHAENISRSMDERIKEMKEDLSKNPCIELDSGEVVWGFQCWWMDQETFERRGWDQLEWQVVPPSKMLDSQGLAIK